MRSTNRRNELLAFCLWVSVVLLVLAPPAAARSAAGRLDRSFGKTGWTVTPPGTAGEGGVQLSLASDGAPVLAELGEAEIFRLLSDGAIDGSFGNHGRLHLGFLTANEGDPGRSFFASSVAVDSTGRLLVFGSQSDSGRSVPVGGMPGGIASSYALVLRLDPSGVLDPTFGAGKGFVRSDFGLTSQLRSKVPLVGAMAGTVDSQDRPVLVAGSAAVGAACVGKGGIEEVPRAVVRLTTAGELDPTFGRAGTSPIEGTQSAARLLIAGEGLLAVGTGRIGGYRPECREGGIVYRIGPAGERSAEFGPAGVRSFKQLHLAALEPSGGVIVDHRQGHSLTFKRLCPSGAPEPTFGSDGVTKVRLPARPGLQVSSVLVDEQRRVLVAGFVEGNPAKHRRAALIVARVLANGKLDPEFGADGWVTTPLPRSLKLTSAQAKLDAQGRLVVAGTAARPGNSDGGYLVARYLLGPG
jgi:uncharacterized delta-60 repeat protein